MSEKLVDITPGTSLVTSLSVQNLTWREVLGELIDNAFDANASSVDLSFDSGRLVITDTGDGCDDLTALATLGKHERKSSTQLGRWGIGAKDAMLWIGGKDSTVRIESTHRGVFRSGLISWGGIRVVDGRWMIDNWHEERTASAGERGTRIVISPVKKTVLHGAQWNSLVADIGYLYSPAIKQGKQITVRRTKAAPTTIVRYELPPLEPGHVDTRITVDGKTARVVVGIVRQGERNDRQGITYTHRFRVIKTASGNGCGSFNYTRVAGVVDLDDGWQLTKNKDGLASHAEELYAAVESAAELVLRRAHVASQQVQFAALESRVNEMLAACVRECEPDRKAKRGKGTGGGSVTPKNTGRKHTRAAIEQPGRTFIGSGTRMSHSAVRIQFTDYDGPNGEPGFFTASESASTPHTVTLHGGHPFIRSCRQENNDRAILAIVASLVCANGGQLSFARSVSDGFEAQVGALLRSSRLNGESA